MTNYFENVPKRIIWIVIGILCYYFAIIPISLIPHVLLPGIGLSYFSGFSSYQFVSTGLLLYFVYRALFKVNPSLMPLIKKYKKSVLIFLIMIPTLIMTLYSGLIVPEWEQGECRISSSMVMQDGIFQGSTTSQSIAGVSECLDHCKFHDDFNPKLEKTCQFRGLFDSAPTYTTKESTEYNIEVTFDGKRK